MQILHLVPEVHFVDVLGSFDMPIRRRSSRSWRSSRSVFGRSYARSRRPYMRRSYRRRTIPGVRGVTGAGVPTSLIRTGGFISGLRTYPEEKYTQLSVNYPAYAGVTDCNNFSRVFLGGLQMGNSPTTRVGTRVQWRSLFINCALVPYATIVNQETSAVVPVDKIRILVVLDRQANGGTPSIADVLDTSLSAGLANLPHNLSNRDRFVTLVDVEHMVGQTTTIPNYGGLIRSTTQGGGLPAGIMVKIFKRLNFVTQFNGGNTGAQGDVASNAMWLFATSLYASSGSISDSYPHYLEGTIRMRFVDT